MAGGHQLGMLTVFAQHTVFDLGVVREMLGLLNRGCQFSILRKQILYKYFYG